MGGPMDDLVDINDDMQGVDNQGQDDNMGSQEENYNEFQDGAEMMD